MKWKDFKKILARKKKKCNFWLFRNQFFFRKNKLDRSRFELCTEGWFSISWPHHWHASRQFFCKRRPRRQYIDRSNSRCAESFSIGMARDRYACTHEPEQNANDSKHGRKAICIVAILLSSLQIAGLWFNGDVEWCAM